MNPLRRILLTRITLLTNPEGTRNEGWVVERLDWRLRPARRELVARWSDLDAAIERVHASPARHS